MPVYRSEQLIVRYVELVVYVELFYRPREPELREPPAQQQALGTLRASLTGPPPASINQRLSKPLRISKSEGLYPHNGSADPSFRGLM